MMENWRLLDSPSGEAYRKLIKTLCENSDYFYFITRKELTYNQEVLDSFKKHVLKSYKTQEWASTITYGPPATVYEMEATVETDELLLYWANSLYDWVSPRLPEDLTFIKNKFVWFCSSSHEELAQFSIRSSFYEKILQQIPGIRLEKVRTN